MSERFELMPHTLHVHKVLEVDFQRNCELTDLEEFLAKQSTCRATCIQKCAKANNSFPIAKAMLAINSDDLMQIWIIGPATPDGEVPYYAQYMLTPFAGHDFSRWSKYVTAHAVYATAVFQEICEYLYNVEAGRTGDVFSQSEYGIE